jgi:hypothetical protein
LHLLFSPIREVNDNLIAKLSIDLFKRQAFRLKTT